MEEEANGRMWKETYGVRQMKIRCPYCGGNSIARIIHGTPEMTEELIQELKQKKAVLAGCDMKENSPTLKCNDCKKKFGKAPVCSIRGIMYRPEDVKEIEYRIGGYFGGYDTVDIRRYEYGRGLLVWHVPEEENRPLYFRAYSKPEWDRMMRTLFCRLFVHEWKLSYENNQIMDGTQWSLILTFSDGNKREIYGSNEYPALWDDFRDRFRRYITEAERNNSDPIDIYHFRELFRDSYPVQEWLEKHQDEMNEISKGRSL